MWKASTVALALVCLFPGLASSLEIKNLRLSYGPLGAPRAESKVLPGDIIFLLFDIDGLEINKLSKIREVSYEIAYDLLDSQNKQKVRKVTPQKNVLALGGNQVPGVLYLNIAQQAAGKYKIKLKVKDRYSNTTTAVDFPFEVLPSTFGFIGVSAPAFDLPGDFYEAKFGLVNMGLDAQKKKPKMDITMRVLDQAGKAVVGLELVRKYPYSLGDDNTTDFQKDNFLPEKFVVYLNRPGQFTIFIEAHDKIRDKKVQLRIPLTVLDLGQSRKNGSAIESK